MHIEVVTNDARFQEIRTAWDVLWTHSRCGLFQSHSWIAAWWSECAQNHRLRILCAWQDDALIAILPL